MRPASAALQALHPEWFKDPDSNYKFIKHPLARRTSFYDGSTTKSYLYDGLDILNNGTSSFLNGEDVDEPLQITTGSTTLSHLADHLGSISNLSTAAGVLQSTNHYTSYGQYESDLTNPNTTNPFTYTAQEDDGLSLRYYRARYYDPNLEIFVSQDPLGDSQRYVGANPLNYADPMGLLKRLLHEPSAEDVTWQYVPVFRGGQIARSIFNTVKTVLGCETQNESAINLGQFKTSQKWQNQMQQRNWTLKKLDEAVTKGKRYSAINNVNKGNSATRYVHPDTGQSVVVDNVTGEVLHLGGPGFKY